LRPPKIAIATPNAILNTAAGCSNYPLELDMPLQAYPYLTQNEFNDIAQEFQEIYMTVKSEDLNDWRSVDVRTCVNLINTNLDIARLTITSQKGST
jgi:hypothetical protein